MNEKLRTRNMMSHDAASDCIPFCLPASFLLLCLLRTNICTIIVMDREECHTANELSHIGGHSLI